MALSVVSRGAYAVGLGIGKGVLPIAAEVITVIAIRLLSDLSPKAKFVMVSFPGAATFYLISNFPRFEASDIIALGIYSLFKVLIWKEVSPAKKPQPTEITLRTQYLNLRDKLKFEAVNKIDLNTPEGRRAVFAYALKIDDEVRDRWKDPNIIRQADALLRKAAREMDALYEDLVKAVADVPEQLRNEKMAELLTRLDGPNEYYARFCKEGSITLLDIYRTLRGLSFSVVCKPAELQFFLSIINNYNAIGYRQLDVDVDPFFTPGTRQYEWRSIYNKSVERFAPIIKEMILMAETLPFLVWAAPDNDKQVVFEGAGKFRLRPCHKPK